MKVPIETYTNDAGQTLAPLGIVETRGGPVLVTIVDDPNVGTVIRTDGTDEGDVFFTMADEWTMDGLSADWSAVCWRIGTTDGGRELRLIDNEDGTFDIFETWVRQDRPTCFPTVCERIAPLASVSLALDLTTA
jgi:hypothetical protein